MVAMVQKLLDVLKRYRWPAIIVGGVVVVGILAVFVYNQVFRGGGIVGPKGGTNPVLISSSDGDTELEISTVGGGEPQLQIRLSEGQAQLQTPEPVPTAVGEPLSDNAIERILARLPALTGEAEDQVDFNLPGEPIPPPRTGETIEETFPPPPVDIQPQPVDTGPLEVLRFAPEGEIPLAPFLNITFNQPMVPLTTLDDLTELDVPVKIEPNLSGTWRWIGTKTLNFQYDSQAIDRLPMATEYQVTIPAGTQSMRGGVLSEAVEWSFTTPAPKMVSYSPSFGPQPLDPIFFIAFDQRIDPETVLPTIEVTADNRPVNLMLLEKAEAEKDPDVSRFMKYAEEGRWMVFQATDLLPADASISVAVGPGTPSAEGPLVTDEAQTFNFRTYAPLKIVEHGCSWRDRCPPLTPFFIRFNNPIDVSAYDETMLQIEPELVGASTNIFGDTIQIQGATEGQTTYRITVNGTIQDVFGQQLGRTEKLTFRVGTADPFLVGPEKILVTLDPASREPIFSVYTMNYNQLEVQIYAVEPSDWPAFKNYLREYDRQDRPPAPPGRLVFNETMRLEAPADKLLETGIDLREVMEGDFGHFIVIVRPPLNMFEKEQDRYWRTIHSWIQVTQIGLDVFSDHSELVVWATALKDGTPLSGVSIEADSAGVNAVTGGDGTVRLEMPTGGATYLVASQGQDKAFLPRSEYYWDEGKWQPFSVSDELRWYVFDDRQMYRPGEKVHIKGWLRRVGGKQDGDVGLVGNTVTSVRFQILGPQGNDMGGGSAEVNALGGFDFAFTLPENTNLGYAQIQFDAVGSFRGLDGASTYHSFQIQEFRRPEFEVEARNETTGPYFAGEHAIVAVSANYFAGGPLPNAEVNWQVTSSPSSYAPPNWPDFVFGTWTPWWYFGAFYAEEAYSPFGPEFGDVEVETFAGVTDASGEHFLRLDFEANEELRPFSVLAEATVIDVNRQAWADTTSLLVHPSELYVGLRSERTFVERGEPLEIELIVTDLDGNPVEDRQIMVQAARLEWKYREGNWREEEVDVQECTIGSTLESVTCTFETPIGGRYQITAVVTDAMGRKNRSQFTRWVSGGERPPSRMIEQETVTLIPDKETYQPGDIAQILVQSPFSPAEGLMTVSRSGILYTERFQVEDGSTTLQVPIKEAHIPNLNVQIDLVGTAPRSDDKGEVLENVPPRPAYATGQLNLSIPPLQRTLSLEVEPRDKELEPGGETTIEVSLTDASNSPVPGAELAVIVVDEAILALTNYQLADPMAIFYQERPSYLNSLYSRASIVLVDPLALTEAATAGVQVQVVEEAEAMMEAPAAEPAADMASRAGLGASESEPQPIRLRMDFNPLATFAPEVRTDENGKAFVEVKLPDNLTRYRVMVVAVDEGKKFGLAEANLVARLPLMVRPSAPRFLNFGDQFELPVVLQNQTDEPLVIDVAVQALNIQLTGDSGLQVTVPARDRMEVRFPATTEMSGVGRFQIAAVSGDYADAAVVELPIYTPATTEAFATYGVVDEGAVAQPVAQPTGVFPQFGGLEINTSSTALQALTDAVLYLVSYPFEGTEQVSSRILAVAALRDVLTAFSAEGLPSPTEIEQAVQRDIEELKGLQNFDGGFPYWRRGHDSIPFNTIHAAHALQMAEIKGFDVPEEMQMSALGYLRDIESHYPSWYGKHTRQTLSAYALYVRDLMGDPDPAKARRLLNDAGLDDLSLEAVGWIWEALVDDPGSMEELEGIRRHINNRVVETAGAANFTTYYDDQTYLLLSSDRRTDAIILDALIADSPQSDLIPKVVNGLLAHRVRGRWKNTQENVFVLLALDRYFNTFETQTPDFVARIWLGDTYAGGHEFVGRETERHETVIPMDFLLDATSAGDGLKDLIMSKEGPGRLYYRLGLRYAPTDLELDPLDMGFVVQRSYEAVDDPQDVFQDRDGEWHFKSGARVRVRLTMVADNRRYHVALVDPLPAGLEIVNPALAVSGSVPQDPNSPDYRYGWWWWWAWYEHQNMRDERAEAFTSLLWDGVYEYTYVTRATTPGRFVVPPAKAEEMYSPEVFGRSGSDVVIVE